MIDNLAQNINDSVRTGLIDIDFESAEEFRPKLIYNDIHKGNTVLADIEKELNECESFWFSVAFITKSGLIVLKEKLKELSHKKIMGKILTTDYLAFNEPDALRELLGFPNLEVRVFTREHFHTKGYIKKVGHFSTNIFKILDHFQSNINKKELGLSIQPAEYSKNPVNMSRQKWEFEQSFKELIYRDVKLCAAYAGSVDHFLYLMKRIGYEFKPGAYLTVKVPGRKLYHKLDKMDEIFTEAEFKYYLGSPYTVIPHYYAKDFWNYRRSNLTPYQKKFYAKMYRLRIVEQKKFYVNSARYAEDLKQFHLLQDEYLMIVNNDIKDVGDLIDYKIKQEKRHDEIDKRQHKIYVMTKVKRSACKSEYDWREFQDWHLEIQEELRHLKEEKQKTKYNQKLADIVMKENLSTAMYVVSEDEPIKTNYEMEVPAYFEAELTEATTVDYEEYDFTDNRNTVGDYPIPEPVVEDTQRDNTEHEVVANIEAGDYNKFKSESHLDNRSELTDVGADVEEREMLASVDGLREMASGESGRKSEPFIRLSNGHDSIVRMQLTYSEYRFMTYSDKAKAFGATEEMSVNDIVNVIRNFYDNCGHGYDFDALMNDADMIFKVASWDAIHEVAEQTSQVIEMLYESYENMPFEGKERKR